MSSMQGEAIYPMGLLLPAVVSYLTELTFLNLGNCTNLESLPEWIGKLCHLEFLDLTNCTSPFFDSITPRIGEVHSLRVIDMKGCSQIKSFPSSMSSLNELISVSLRKCSFHTLPSGIEYLHELTSLDLTECNNIESLPTTLHHLTRLTDPLFLAGFIPVYSDIDWSQFPTEVSIALYLEYMMRMNRIDSIFSYLLEYMKNFDPQYRDFKSCQISKVYALIQRSREGGGDLIKHFCSMLTNGGIKRMNGYRNRILEWTKEKKKKDGLNCLKILYWSVCGTEQHRKVDYLSVNNYNLGRRMREVWKDEGKEDSEKRREWERRWREAVDIIVEEDVVETAVMHLLIIHRIDTKTNTIVFHVCHDPASTIFRRRIADPNNLYQYSISKPCISMFYVPSPSLIASFLFLIPYSHITFSVKTHSSTSSRFPVISVSHSLKQRLFLHSASTGL